jgi:undecaprenyl diphosphate synthase
VKNFKEQINPDKLPQHIAIIMDGNGRWAKGKGMFRVFGHQNGVHTVRRITEAAAEIGVKYLTLYAFSTENWNRPSFEVKALMELLVDTIAKETPDLMKNKIRLVTIGQMDALPEKCQKQLQKTIEATAQNTGLTLILALSYSAKWDLTHAVKSIALAVQSGTMQAETINESTINNFLSTANYPHPDLLIRTSGEQRISNFLLWEIAYSELFFSPKLWPDFSPEDLYQAILDFQNRERRYGKISEQVSEQE